MKLCRLAINLVLVNLIGGLGCWIALGQYFHDPKIYDYRNFLGNVGTFAISMGVIAYADGILSKRLSNVTLALFIFLLMVVSAGLSILCMVTIFDYATFVSILGLVFALVCWTIINWGNPQFTDKPSDPLAAMGGAITIPPVPAETSA